MTYSTGATIRFDLDDHQTLHSLQSAIASVRYTGGYTATALALFLARIVLDPTRDYGARPLSNGIPRIAVLLTDGRSNLYSIIEFATNLRRSGVLVYTVGIENIYLPELRFIASDPDPLHVFLLDSFNDAAGFVDFLSFTTCDGESYLDLRSSCQTPHLHPLTSSTSPPLTSSHLCHSPLSSTPTLPTLVSAPHPLPP